MKLKFLSTSTAAALVAVALSAPSAEAAPLINGDIFFEGTVTLDAPIPNATSFSSFTGVHVDVTMGDYTSIADGTAVSVTGFQFDPDASPVSPLWTIAGGWSFTLDGPLTVVQSDDPVEFLLVTGPGTASGPGFADSPGTFTITTQSDQLLVSFSSHTDVPDGGTTVALLGCSLLGLQVLRKRLKRA